MSIVFTSTIANSLKRTLEKVVDDEMSSAKKKLVMPKFCDETSMEDNYVDFLEMGGPGLASEKAEGSEMALGTIKEGVLTRFISRTFALRLIITQEALEDKKYDETINAAERLARSMWKSVDYDAANILIRAFNASFVIGDGLPFISNAHTLPNGGTFSNQMAVPMSPSRQAIQIATTQLRKYPGHDGLIEGYRPQCIVAPVDQEFVWKGVLRSEYAPEPGAYNEINVINRDYDIDLVLNQFWTNTTTNWIVLTDAEDGIKWLWRVKPKGSSWVNNDNQVMLFGMRARWARGPVDPRCALGVAA
jgi:hypothetical protein